VDGFSINPEKFAGGFGKWRMFKVEGFSLSCYNPSFTPVSEKTLSKNI